jgi:hypothetical protein
MHRPARPLGATTGRSQSPNLRRWVVPTIGIGVPPAPQGVIASATQESPGTGVGSTTALAAGGRSASEFSSVSSGLPTREHPAGSRPRRERNLECPVLRHRLSFALGRPRLAGGSRRSALSPLVTVRAFTFLSERAFGLVAEAGSRHKYGPATRREQTRGRHQPGNRSDRV